jgi:hypothetical protein
MVVGVERFPTLSNPHGEVAHAVPDLGAATALGLAVCGMPVEALTLRVVQGWEAVDVLERCPHCDEIVADRAPRSDS